MEGPVVEAYEQASTFFVAAVARVPAGAWDRPGLGEWTVRDLVAHANRAHLLIEEYLARPVAEEPPDAEYWHAENIAARGREAVALLGDDPASVVREAGRRAVSVVRSTPADAFLGSPVRHQTLAEYVPSRVAELVIHTLDLHVSLGSQSQVPDGALRTALASTVEAVLARGEGVRVLRALSGREGLRAGFSVY